MHVASQHLGSTRPARRPTWRVGTRASRIPKDAPPWSPFLVTFSRGTPLLKVRTELPSHSRFPAYFCQMVIPLPSYAFNVTIII